MKKISQIKIENSILIYSDGSKNENSNKLGAGIAYTEDKYKFVSDSWNLGSESEVFDTELFAIMKAFKLIEIKTYKRADLNEAWIFSDSQAALKRLRNSLMGTGVCASGGTRTGAAES